MAVPCMSATDMVGVGAGPHADNIVMTNTEIRDINFLFIFFSIFNFTARGKQSKV